MTAKIERGLQREIMLRLNAWPVLALPIPNSIYFPARTEAERNIIARVIAQMKQAGQLVPGAPDLVIFWQGGGGLIELKRPPSRDLLGKRAAGRPTVAQRDIASQAAAIGVNHAYCTSWEDVLARLQEWGAPIPPRLADMVRGLPNTTLDDMIDEEATR